MQGHIRLLRDTPWQRVNKCSLVLEEAIVRMILVEYNAKMWDCMAKGEYRPTTC